MKRNKPAEQINMNNILYKGHTLIEHNSRYTTFPLEKYLVFMIEVITMRFDCFFFFHFSFIYSFDLFVLWICFSIFFSYRVCFVVFYQRFFFCSFKFFLHLCHTFAHITAIPQHKEIRLS